MRARVDRHVRTQLGTRWRALRHGAAIAVPALVVAGLPPTVVAPAVATAPPFTALATAAARCAGQVPTLVGTRRADELHGTPGRDVILARGGDDIIDAAGGDDIVCAGHGHDVLRGGPGNDELRVGPVELGGEPDLVTFDRSRHGVRVDLAQGSARGQGWDRIVADELRVYGSEHDDVLVGHPTRVNMMAGLGGDDRVLGGGANDWLYGDNARPTRVSGDDHVVGRAGDDELNGGAGDDMIRAGRGNDFLREWPDQPSGADTFLGGPGDDVVEDDLEHGVVERFDGGGGEDWLLLATYFLDHGRRVFPSGRILLDRSLRTAGPNPARGVATSFELVIAPVGGWTIVGTVADERLWAPRRDHNPRQQGATIRGRGGDDNLIGTPFADVLVGGPGHDLACGVGGDDTVTAEEQAVLPIDLCDPR